MPVALYPVRRFFMDHNITIGSKIKALRKEKNMTLKQLSDGSGLSVGFLSQLERGISSIAIDSLAKIAEILGVNLSTFFQEMKVVDTDPVVHSYDMLCTQVSPQIIQFILSNDVSGFGALPRIFQLMPQANADIPKLEMYCHTGEEFIYVLEGVVTVFIGDSRYCLYPGDSIQVRSNQPHNWINYTNKIAKILTFNYPNPFRGQKAGDIEHPTPATL